MSPKRITQHGSLSERMDQFQLLIVLVKLGKKNMFLILQEPTIKKQQKMQGSKHLTKQFLKNVPSLSTGWVNHAPMLQL